MAKINIERNVVRPRTHEGGVASRIGKEQELKRTVNACLLWEDNFYESGKSVADRIRLLVPEVNSNKVIDIAVNARTSMHLRHVPLLLARELARKEGAYVGGLLPKIIQRPDELTEFLAIYWKDGKEPLSAQVKKGLAQAFHNFDQYQLTKYNSDSPIKLRDVAFLVHPKPATREQAKIWASLFNAQYYPEDVKKFIGQKKYEKLDAPDTWEVNLSAGADKKDTFKRLSREKKLGGLATLRNLRNMQQSGMKDAEIREAIKNANYRNVLPFRFITAAKYAPRFEDDLEREMFTTLRDSPIRLKGETVLLIDVSGSMDHKLSDNSEVDRLQAACGLAMLARELCENVRVYTFSNQLVEIAPRRGFALRDAIQKSQLHSGTYLKRALENIRNDYDRIIVITDEQTHDGISNPKGDGYLINVGAYQNGVGYGAWTHIDGFSEATLDYIHTVEKE